MRLILLSISVLLVLCGCGFAEKRPVLTDKFLATGAASRSESNDGNKAFGFQFEGQTVKFTDEHLAYGGVISYYYSSGSGATVATLLVGPSLVYAIDIKDLKGTVPYVGISAGPAFRYKSYDTDDSGFFVAMGGGALLFISERWAIDAYFNYTVMEMKEKDESGFMVGLAISVLIGGE